MGPDQSTASRSSSRLTRARAKASQPVTPDESKEVNIVDTDTSSAISVPSTPKVSETSTLSDPNNSEDDFQKTYPRAAALGKRRAVAPSRRMPSRNGSGSSASASSAAAPSLKRTRSTNSVASSTGPPRKIKREDTSGEESQEDDENDEMEESGSASSSSLPQPVKGSRRSNSSLAAAKGKKVAVSSAQASEHSASSAASSSKVTSTEASTSALPSRAGRSAASKARATIKSQARDDTSGSESDAESSSVESDDDGSDDDEAEKSSFEEDTASSSSAEDSPVPATIPARRRRRNTGNRNRAPRLTWFEKVNIALLEHHPELARVWDDLDKVESVKPELAEQPEGLSLQLLPFQREGLSWLQKQENTMFKGGILADEMGMGKTIQTIALLLASPGKPNLIVAPTVAIVQWSNEIKQYAPSLKVLIFHGAGRTESISELKKHDVVLTTYSILEASFRKEKYGVRRQNMTVKEDSLLHKIKWHRIILDEAHNIKERSSNTARSAFELQSDRKWSLSGTPMQNRVGELYSLIRFMEADPYGYYFCKLCTCKSLHWKYSNKKDCDDCGHRPMDHVCWWNNEILKPIQQYGTGGVGAIAFTKLRKLLERMMLRRTKVERADDLGLPPRKCIVAKYLFNEEEEDLYESLYSDTQRKFTTYVEQGTVLNNYANIFELLTKMRQMVDHPDLVLKRVKPGEAGLPETLVCCICQEEAEDPIVSKCHHLFCREDASQYVTSSMVEAPECPVCHIPLTIDLQQPTYIPSERDDDADVRHKTFARTSIVNRINMDTWRSSTKIEALVEQLYNLQREDRTIKSICFSQYVNFLDLVKWRLEKAGFKCCKLDGTMTPFQRDATIRKFSEDPTITVFLISLKAGGVALNLTAASRVFICDPWWNPAAELQAMDRIHRIGQHRPILITRLIIENSIESRILQLQEKKQAMVDSTIGKDPAALARLTPEDLRFLFVN
ncbi:DNA repair protein rad16 [Actinomortierella wolfii]|nr:DNA repair protein rad16 [Actinomortierella wolfii]